MPGKDLHRAARIKAARERAGLTQRELAERLNVSEDTIGNWERGVPPRNKLAQLLDVLGLDENYEPISRQSNGRLTAQSTADLVSRLQVLLAEASAVVSELARRGSVEVHAPPGPRHAADSPTAAYYQEDPPGRAAETG